MPDYEEPEHFTLYQILSAPGSAYFIFRTGMFKHFSLETHQFPIQNSFREIHKTALHRIPLLIHHDGETYFIMVSTNHQGQVQRSEYLIKRTLLDLQEQYGWEVKVC